MALKTGKKTVNLKSSVADNIGIPKFPDTTISATIAKPVSEAIDAFRKKAEADANASWQFQFNQQSRDHYLNLRDKFKFDPDGMRNAIDSYSKTTLANTPTAYKNVAQNILAGKNLANMSYATTNYNAMQDQQALDGWNTTRKDFLTDNASFLDNIHLNESLSVMDINSHVGNKSMIDLNHNYGLAENTLVSTNRKNNTELGKELENDIIDLEALRVFSIMKKVGEVDGNKYFLNYAAGEDNMPVTPDNVNNPIFQKYANDIKNPFVRAKVINKVKSLYNDYNGQAIGGLKKASIDYNLDNETKLGGKMFIGEFINKPFPNVNQFLEENYPGIKPKKAFEFAETMEKYKDIVLKVDQAERNIIVDLDEKDKDLFETALLANVGITNKNITDVENNDIGTVVDILKRQNIIPKAIIGRLNKSIDVDYNNPGMIDNFKNNLSLYNYMKTQYNNLDVQNEFIYEQANNLISEGISDNTTLANELNNIAKNSGNFKENLSIIDENLKQNVNQYTEVFTDVISKLDINTDTSWFVKLTLDEQNKLTDLFQPKDTILPSFASTLLNDDIKAQWLKHTMSILANKNGNKPFDISTDSGKAMFESAAKTALFRLEKTNIGATKFSNSGNIEMVRFPYEKYGDGTGAGFENSILALANQLDQTLSDEEKGERFGYKETGFGIPLTDMKIGRKQVPNSIVDIVKTALDENYKGIIIESDGTMGSNNKPNYHLKINHEGYTINLTQGNNYFDPTGLNNRITNTETSRDQIINELADKKYQRFEELFGDKLEYSPFSERWTKEFIRSTIRQGVSLSNYQFYPDWPLLNDVPEEVRPFAFIFKVLGKDVDLKPYYNEIAQINSEIDKSLSYESRIQNNKKFNTIDKRVESSTPPHETTFARQKLGFTFKQHVYDNIDNKELPLTFRTNNYMAVMKTDQTWEGEMTDVNTGNQAAVFASPVDSIRAGVRVMINNSTLSSTNTTKRYGNNPTIGEILTVYAEDTEPYLNALEQKTNFTRDTAINFFDSTQMASLIKFMIEHEMGSKAFYDVYPPGRDAFLDMMILQGYDLGIQSYGGKLGKVK